MSFRQIEQKEKYKTMLQLVGKGDRYRSLTEAYHQGNGDEFEFIQELLVGALDIYNIKEYADAYTVLDPIFEAIGGHMPYRDVVGYFFHISIEFDHGTGVEHALTVEVTFYDLNSTMANRKQIGHVKTSL